VAVQLKWTKTSEQIKQNKAMKTDEHFFESSHPERSLMGMNEGKSGIMVMQ
jgi:hypothetical protein